MQGGHVDDIRSVAPPQPGGNSFGHRANDVRADVRVVAARARDELLHRTTRISDAIVDDGNQRDVVSVSDARDGAVSRRSDCGAGRCPRRRLDVGSAPWPQEDGDSLLARSGCLARTRGTEAWQNRPRHAEGARGDVQLEAQTSLEL